MFLKFTQRENGINLQYNTKNFSLTYPKEIWQNYPQKDLLIDNIAHTITITSPITTEKKRVKYNTSKPITHKKLKKLIINDLKSSTDPYPHQSPNKLIKEFKKIKYKFDNKNIRKSNYDSKLKEKAIVPFSCGKDSLLTLALARELNLDPVMIYINDTVSPTENKLKLNLVKKISKEFGFPLVQVTNTIEQFNDFEFWDKNETCVCYAHMLTGFSLIALPIAHYYKAKYILLGNQKDMDFSYVNKEGQKAYPAYDQTSKWQKQQNKIIKELTNNKVKVTSLIRPLTNIAITKVLFGRYPELAKYQVSCDCLNISKQKRWCFNCSKCARLSLFMLANNLDPKIVNLKPLLNKSNEKLYTLFNGLEVDQYEKSKESKEQQLLAFYLAYKNGYKGYLIDKFKELFLEKAREKEDYLHKKFFKIYKSDIPKKLKKPLVSILKEELT